MVKNQLFKAIPPLEICQKRKLDYHFDDVHLFKGGYCCRLYRKA